MIQVNNKDLCHVVIFKQPKINNQQVYGLSIIVNITKNVPKEFSFVTPSPSQNSTSFEKVYFLRPNNKLRKNWQVASSGERPLWVKEELQRFKLGS